MQRTAVKSSQLAEIGYDAAERVLEVLFVSGGVYRYADVPQNEYERLMGAESIGSYFGRHVRTQYKYAKVEEMRPFVVALLGEINFHVFTKQEADTLIDAVMARVRE